MAGITRRSGRDMSIVLACCDIAVMAGFTSAGYALMGKTGQRPIIGRVASVTGRGRLDMP